jgi:cytochrome c biogenesis protein CcmG, thiol:disulfide interchange protein DsbE
MRGKLQTLALLVAGVALLGGCKRSESVQAGAGVGSAAPEASLSIPTLDDMTASINQYKGKVVLVNFWATWCAPCQKEIPWLIKLNDQYSSHGLVILGVSMDDDGKKVVAPFVMQRHFDVDGKSELMDYPILLGSDAISEKFGGLLGLPTSMLYSRDGRKVQTIVGAVNSYGDFTKAVDKAL